MRLREKCMMVSLSLLSLAVATLATADDPRERHIAQSAPATFTFQGRDIPNTLDEILNPKHTAVIVHEMINDLVSPGGELDKQGRGYSAAQMAKLVPQIQKVLAVARAKRVRVIYMRYTSHADGSTSSDAIRRNYLSRGEQPERMHIEGEWGWEVIDALKPQAQDLVLRKYRPDAFYGTVLDSVLRWNGIKTIVMVGVGVSVGGIPTLTTASNLGYFGVAVSDSLLSADSRRTADALAYLGDYAILKTHAEVMEIWSRSPPRPPDMASAEEPRQPGKPSTAIFEGRGIPIAIEEILNPTHTVLLVHEMLNDFISPGGAEDQRGRRYDPIQMAKIVPPIQRLLATARERNVRVVYVRSTNPPVGFTPSDPQIQRSWSVSGQPPPALPTEGSWGAEIIDDLKPMAGDAVVPKYRPDAFFGTSLDALLKWNGIKTIVFVGIDSNAGGIQTLMRAWYLGYFRVVVSDGILARSSAQSEFATTYFKDCMPTTHQEVIDTWKKHAPRARP